MQGEMYVSPLDIRVISSVHVVEKNDHSGMAPHFHLSITMGGTRAPASIVPDILRQFGASDFEEDNHAPGKQLRSFWKLVEGEDKTCPCKNDEKPEIHGDYIWRPDNQQEAK